jgi:hypothetical protein
VFHLGDSNQMSWRLRSSFVSHIASNNQNLVHLSQEGMTCAMMRFFEICLFCAVRIKFEKLIGAVGNPRGSPIRCLVSAPTEGRLQAALSDLCRKKSEEIFAGFGWFGAESER